MNNKGKRNNSNAKKSYNKGNSRKGNKSNPGNRSKYPTDSDNWNGKAIPDTNEFAWYNKYPDLINSVARIPFAKRPGMGFDLPSYNEAVYDPDTDAHTIDAGTINNSQTIPTLMTIHWIPTIGRSVDNQSPASIAARELYAKVRSAYSGSLDENAPDLLMYVMALDSVFAYLAWMKRIYRALNSYSPNNKGIPYAILAAEGFSSAQMTNLFQNRPRMFGLINQLIYNVSKFTCPDVMDIFKRHYWMSSNIYTDENSKYAQMYMFIPDGFYQFNDSGSSGTQLDYVSKTFSGSDPLPSLWEIGNNLISALSASDDAYTMNGHLMRAFEGTKNFVIAPLQELEVLDFVVDPVVLMQINNAHSPINAKISNIANITQDPTTNAVIQHINDSLKSQSTFKYMSRLLLNIPSDNPSVADIVEATRLMTMMDNDTYVASGTEIVSYFGIMEHTKDSSTWTERLIPSIISTNEVPNLYAVLSQWACFNYSPTLYVYSGSNTYPVTNLFNITHIGKEELDQLHEICVYSEFNSFDIK